MNTLNIGNAACDRQHSFCLSGLAIVAFFVISVPAEATSICRWIDENGQVRASIRLHAAQKLADKVDWR